MFLVFQISHFLCKFVIFNESSSNSFSNAKFLEINPSIQNQNGNKTLFKFVFIVTIQPLEDQNKQSKLIFEAPETQGTQ